MVAYCCTQEYICKTCRHWSLSQGGLSFELESGTKILCYHHSVLKACICLPYLQWQVHVECHRSPLYFWNPFRHQHRRPYMFIRTRPHVFPDTRSVHLINSSTLTSCRVATYLNHAPEFPPKKNHRPPLRSYLSTPVHIDTSQ
jgi:hypothetical protein